MELTKKELGEKHIFAGIFGHAFVQTLTYLKEYEKARELLKKTIEVLSLEENKLLLGEESNRLLSSIHCNKAEMELLEGKVEDAENSLKEAAQILKSEDANILMISSQIAAEKKEFDLAVELSLKALQYTQKADPHNSTFSSVFQLHLENLIKAGKFEEAEEALIMACQKASSAKLFTLHALQLQRLAFFLLSFTFFFLTVLRILFSEFYRQRALFEILLNPFGLKCKNI